jgi:DNA-binding transcriptional ArsR family regulator
VRARPDDPQAVPSLAEVEAVFLALSHEARRHVILLLSQLGGELPSGYLAARFQHSWPTTTRHLKVLEEAGLVEVRREGRGSHYRLNRERLRRVVGGWLRHVDPVGPDRKWTSSGPKSTDALAGAAEKKTTHTTPSKKKQTGLKGAR